MQHLRGKNDLVDFFLKNGNEGKMKVLIRAFMKILLKLFHFKKIGPDSLLSSTAYEFSLH
jgi:hypothetical protein